MLRYKTFSELMSSVKEDLYLYDTNNLIKDYRYIKTARKCNATLGIKINKHSSAIIEINNFKGELPIDFYKVMFAYAIYEETMGKLFTSLGSSYKVISKEELIQSGIPKDFCCSEYKDGKLFLSKTSKDETYLRYNLKPLTISTNSVEYCDKRTFKFQNKKSEYEIDIHNNEIFTNFKEGSIYLEYMCDMVNEDGDLLVLEHPLVDGYYEAQIKEKILADLLYNKEVEGISELLKDTRNTLSIEENKAKRIINEPGYKKWQDYIRMKDKELYNKHIKMFY